MRQGSVRAADFELSGPLLHRHEISLQANCERQRSIAGGLGGCESIRPFSVIVL